MAGGNFPPMVGLPSGEVCGFASAVSRVALPCGNFASSGPSPGVLFSEPGAFVKCFSHTAQGRREAFGSLPLTGLRALNEALVLRGRALLRGFLPATPCLHATSALLDPSETLGLAPRNRCLRGLLTLISRSLAIVRGVFPVVCDSLALIRDSLALIRDQIALVRDQIALICGLLASVCQSLALLAHLLGDRGLWPLLTAATLTTQPATLALKSRIISREPRRPALNLPIEAVDLGPGRLIGRSDQAAAQLCQSGATRLQPGCLALERGAALLELSPLRIAARLPRRHGGLVVCCALLMPERSPRM